MAVRKSKNGTWIADVSSGTNPITLLQRRIVRKGFKTKNILRLVVKKSLTGESTHYFFFMLK